MKKTSRAISVCGGCGSQLLESMLFLGYLPPVNTLVQVGSRLAAHEAYPAELLRCSNCTLVQIGCVVDKEILFPHDYPYTSSTTKNLRENFAELAERVMGMVELDKDNLVVDVGSNDGNLLTNFLGTCRVLGVTPEAVGRTAEERGVPTVFEYFGREVASKIAHSKGWAKVVTCTNCFAHVDDVDDFVAGVKEIMAKDGLFVTESHYLPRLVESLQYDTVYHEHLRYYSLTSLSRLLTSRGLHPFHAEEIDTHGGSIRVFASLDEGRPASDEMSQLLAEEAEVLSPHNWRRFRGATAQSKILMHALIASIVDERDVEDGPVRIMGVGAPSRATTLVSYMGLDEIILDAVVEVSGSRKVGHFVPGTKIPIIDEGVLFDFKAQPDYALLLSWHIADELIPKLRAKGFHGKFIVPLPTPRIVDSLEELHDVVRMPGT